LHSGVDRIRGQSSGSSPYAASVFPAGLALRFVFLPPLRSARRLTLAGGIGGQVPGRPVGFPLPAGEGKGEGENVRRLAACESNGRFRPFSLTSILSRWERRPRPPPLSEVRARDRSVEHDDLPTGAETDFLSQRERVRVREKSSDVLRRANPTGDSGHSPSPQSSPAGRGGHARRVSAKSGRGIEAWSRTICRPAPKQIPSPSGRG